VRLDDAAGTREFDMDRAATQRSPIFEHQEGERKRGSVRRFAVGDHGVKRWPGAEATTARGRIREKRIQKKSQERVDARAESSYFSARSEGVNQR
jgi:hypothetical protein